MDQSNPGNHENSLDGADARTHPSALLKQPISKTWPAGLAKVWAKPWPVFSENIGLVIKDRQLRQEITGSGSSMLWASLRVPVSGSAFLQTSSTALAASFPV